MNYMDVHIYNGVLLVCNEDISPGLIQKMELLMNYFREFVPKYSASRWSGWICCDRHPLGPKIDCFNSTPLTVLLSPLFNSHSV